MIDSNMLRYASNPRGFALKKWFTQMLGDKYPLHDNIVERVGSALVTEQDLKEFGKLLSTVYEVGYMKAISDYKSQVESLGIKIKMVDNQEKSGDTSDGTDSTM